MNQTVSIIIPIYNEEKNLRRCVDSVITQTYKDLEIILVDDGSTDASPKICDAYAEDDPRVRVIHQSNKGLSAARNAGIDIASSPFLQFADSDDYLLPSMTEELMSALMEDNSSVAQCRFFVRDDNDAPVTPIKNPSKAERKTYRGEDMFSLLTKHYVSTVVQWNKLFRREIFDDLRYPEGKYHEDEFVIHRQLAKMDSITRIDHALYCYIQRQGSITDRSTAEKAIHACEAYLDRVAFLVENQYLQHAGAAYVKMLELLAYNREFLMNEPDGEVSIAVLDRIQGDADRIARDHFPWADLSEASR